MNQVRANQVIKNTLDLLASLRTIKENYLKDLYNKILKINQEKSGSLNRRFKNHH